MCGLVTMIARNQSGFLHSDMELMENLLVLDTLRGMDSTGIFGVERNRHVGVMKVASHPLHMFACDDWGKFKSKSVQSGRILVGHNRKATQGAITSENAHPFHENNIILSHNGTLRGGHKHLADTEVDSHAVCHAFNEKGAETVIPTIDGAFAFIWWDIEKAKLFAIRNEERPLHMVTTDNLVILISEPWMASCLLARRGTKVLSIDELSAGTLFEFDLNGKFITKDIELHHPKVHVFGTNNGTDSSKKDAGALTLIKNTTTQHSGSDTDKAPSTSNSQFVDNKDFPRNSRVLCKIREWKLTADAKQYRITGVVAEPTKPPIDFVCHMTVGTAGLLHITEKMPAFMEGHVTAEVLAYTSSTCGPSIFVKDFQLDTDVSLHMSSVMPLTIWKHIVDNVKCKCGSVIYHEEHPFTSVSQKADGSFRVICADCIEDKLPIGDIKNEFQQRRNDALQDELAVCNKSGLVIVPAVNKESTPTLH